jgi:protein-tyrosine phosphatase
MTTKKIEYLNLQMRDQVDCDLTVFLYTAIDFIERAQAENQGQSRILVHCYKVRY